MTYGADLSDVTTLDDVLVNVFALFAAVDPTVTLTQGDLYNANDGAPPRIHFVIGQDGKFGGVLEVGARQVGSVAERCTCYIWGDSTAADADRNRAAKALGVRTINAFKATAPGRLVGAQLTRADKTKIAKYGEEYTLAIVYSWGVPYDQAVWDAAYGTAPTPPGSPPNPDQPNGDTGATFSTGAVNLSNARQ